MSLMQPGRSYKNGTVSFQEREREKKMLLADSKLQSIDYSEFDSRLALPFCMILDVLYRKFVYLRVCARAPVFPL